VSVIKSVLVDQKHGWLKEAGAVTQLWEASMMLVITLENTFLPRGAPDREFHPDQQTKDRWRARYRAALRCISFGKGGLDHRG
jgi:hypothetical protein